MNIKKSNTSGVSPIWPILSVTPAIVAIFIFSVIPCIFNILVSFTDYTGNLSIPLKFVGLKNYIDFFSPHTFNDIGRALKITFIFSFFTTIIQQGISILVAALVNMKLRLKSFYRAVYFLPSILGVVVVGLVWSLMLDPYSGFFAYILGLFGKTSAFFGDPNIALPLVIMVTIWANFGFAMTIYLAGLQNIPGELYESGDIDGTSKWQRMLYITLPMLRPALTINFWISISGTLGMYDIILVLTNGGPYNSTRTFAMYFFQEVTTLKTNQGFVAAMSIYWFFIITTIMMTFNYFFRRKEVEV